MSELIQGLCRAATGVFWLYFASQKWGGVSWMQPLIAESAARNPIPGLHELLVQVAAPHWLAFALVQAVGETVVGACLVLGLATRWAAWLGVLLALGLCSTIAFLQPDVGLRWLYYLALLANVMVAVNGPGAPAAERLRVVPRWLRS